MLQTAQRTTKLKRKKRATASLGEAAAADKTAPPHDRFLEAFRWMLLARTLEEKLVSLYRGGQITGGVYIGKGQEAVSVACGLFLEKGDIFAPLIRDQAGNR
jgi:pyruvate dehydrogenase E1 component alpha subunit/2-oxoisovalerate dehydrogenase E1 component alpha subunit